jgi:hypothetical protein
MSMEVLDLFLKSLLLVETINLKTPMKLKGLSKMEEE